MLAATATMRAERSESSGCGGGPLNKVAAAAPGTVLVVEDQAEVRTAMIVILETCGYRAIGAENGSAALELLSGGLRPELILLDLTMPVMDGWAFREIQLRDPHLRYTPTIVCSALPEHDAKVSSLKPTAYLRKPLDPDRLLGLVAAHCMAT